MAHRLIKRQKPNKVKRALLYALGAVATAGVGGVCLMGVTTVFARMTEQSENTIASALSLATMQPQSDTNDVTTTGTPDWTSEQIEWMRKNHITYNKFGLPVDEDGEVVDDPTTDTDDRLRMKYFYNDDGSEKDFEAIARAFDRAENGEDTSKLPVVSAPTKAPTAETNDVAKDTSKTQAADAQLKWYQNSDGSLKDGIELDENGKPYHVVTPTDCLSLIGSKYGFDYHELARINGIKNVNLIIDDSRIYFE